MSSSANGKRGRPYVNGRSVLVRASYEPGDELQGGWTREQLIRMDDRFVERLERAFRLGLERRTSASANARWAWSSHL